MVEFDNLPPDLLSRLKERIGDLQDLALPPPVFTAMRGEVVEYAQASERLTHRFPVLEHQLNPFQCMQGGIIAAAVDNTIGLLSLLVAPPSVTRSLQLDYRKPVPKALGHILVTASYLEQNGRELIFGAEVLNDQGEVLATAKAVHRTVGVRR